MNNITYADDTVVLADSIDELREEMERINTVSKDNGLNFNFSKTKWMLISKSQQPAPQLQVAN